MIFALVGNQNCGKTTLFNALTGSNQHVGNFPGVTVDQKMGEITDEKGCAVVDLPVPYMEHVDQTARNMGCKVTAHRLILDGLCPQCAKMDLDS